jgi:hypothetical protein
VERALAPVAIGLTFSSGLALMRATETGFMPHAITVLGAAAFAFTKINPIMLLCGGAAAMVLTSL